MWPSELETYEAPVAIVGIESTISNAMSETDAIFLMMFSKL